MARQLLAVMLIAAIALRPLNVNGATFNIVHLNDMHSRLEPADSNFQISSSCTTNDALCYGGFARMKTLIDEVKATGPTLVLDAGDQFTGTLYSYFYRGEEAYTFQNLLGFSAMTLGNHEFDYGAATLASYIRNLTFPVATCNVEVAPSSPLFGVIKREPVTLDLTMPDLSVLKVGIVGWTTVDTVTISSPGVGVTFLPLVSSVQSCVDQLQKEGVDIIIGLGHAGLQTGGDTLVAAEVTGIDLVIGGHSHTFLYNGVGPILNVADPTSPRPDQPTDTYPFDVESTVTPGAEVPYYQAYWGSRYVGVISVTFDAAGNLTSQSGAPVLLGGSGSSNPVASDPTIAALVQTYSAPLTEFRNTTIGTAGVYLDGVRTTVRGEESNLGNLICDALLREIKSNPNFESTYGPIDIAVTNGGGIRAAIPAGRITLDDILTVLPFGNVLAIKKVTGTQLLSILSRSADAHNGGGFLQTAGLYYAFDTSKAAGQRIVDAKLLNPTTKCLSAIDPSAEYNIVTNEFTGRGGDGYTDFANAPTIFATGRVMADIVSDYITDFAPVRPSVEGRVRILDADTAPSYVVTPICPGECSLSPIAYICMTPTCGAVTADFRVFDGLDFAGNNLRVSRSRSSISSCTRTCRSLGGCRGFTFRGASPTNGQCFFKSALSTPTTATGVVSYAACYTPPSPPPTCGAEFEGYQVYRDTSYPGNVYAVSPRYTLLATCANVCAASFRCAGFTALRRSASKFQCWYKERMEGPTVTAGHMSFVSCKAAKRMAVCGSEITDYASYPNTDYSGSTIGSSPPGRSAVACARACKTNPRCKGFSRVRSTGRCYYKGAVPRYSADAGIDSYLMCEEKPLTFSIVHYNDVHSRLEPADNSGVICQAADYGSCFGGFARLSTIIQSVRAAGPTLVLDMGDQFTGTLYSYLYRGLEAYTVQNLLGVTAMTLGNHEFDYGPTTTANYIKNLTFPIATCNVVPKASSVLFGVIKPGPVIVDLLLPDGVMAKIGLVGWTTPTTYTTSSPGPDVDFLPLVSSVQSCVDELKAVGVNIIIGMGHAGIEDSGDFAVAKGVMGIDLIVGGHSHTFMYNGAQGPTLLTATPNSPQPDVPQLTSYPYEVQSDLNASLTVPYAQCFYASKYIGNLALTFTPKGELLSAVGSPILSGGAASSNSVAMDPTMAATVQELAAPLVTFRNTVVGTAGVLLDGVRSNVRTRETNLGNLITDAMLTEVKANPQFEATFGPVNVALTNGGGIRASIAAGNVTISNVVTVLPFGNTLAIKKLTGAGLLSLLSRSADQYNAVSPQGGFLQVAGLYYAFDFSKANGERLLEAKLKDPSSGCLVDIDPTAEYNIVTNDFTGRGGDGYTVLGQAPSLLDTGRVLSDIVGDYIGANSPVAPTVEGRIVGIDGSTETFTPAETC